MDADDRPEARFETGIDRATPRAVVKALLRPPLVDKAIARALVAKYVPLNER